MAYALLNFVPSDKNIYKILTNDLCNFDTFFANYSPSHNSYNLKIGNFITTTYFFKNTDEVELFEYVYKKDYLLNPYFFTIANTQNNKPKFNSLAEENLYPILCNKYGESNIKCNEPLLKYLNILEIEKFLIENWVSYLKTCRADFIILKNGSISKVIELQKGEHHNKHIITFIKIYLFFFIFVII